MGLKERNNPLGQRIPSDKVGGPTPRMKHGQSAELVEEVKKKAAELSRKGSDARKRSKTA